jgi:type II secretory pathway pseudopilin PulG
VPPNLPRFLPIILLAVLALFVLPALLKKNNNSGPSASDRAKQTMEAMNLIDKGEQAYRTANGRFTSHLADLIPLSGRLGTDLAIGLDVNLDVSTKGDLYVASVTSDVLRLVRSRDAAGKIAARSCLVIKSSKGVSCPTTPAKK